MSFDTIFPLLLANKKELGGFEFDAVAESWICTFSTSLQVFSCIHSDSLLIIVPLTPVWCKLSSYRHVTVWTIAGFAICMLFTPVMSLFNDTPEIVLVLKESLLIVPICNCICYWMYQCPFPIGSLQVSLISLILI